MVAGAGFEPRDLRLMRPAGTSRLPYPALDFSMMVAEPRVELYFRVMSPACDPHTHPAIDLGPSGAMIRCPVLPRCSRVSLVVLLRQGFPRASTRQSIGADGGDRTHDLALTKGVLYH